MSRTPDQLLVVRVSAASGAVLRESTLIAGGDHAVISSEPTGNCAGVYGGELGGLAAAADERSRRLAGYDDGLVAGWVVGGRAMAQRLDATGAAVGAAVQLGSVRFDSESDWVTEPDGDVVWAFSEGGALKLARLRACVP